MSDINPFTGAVGNNPQLQRLQNADKARQLRRVQQRSKNSGLSGEELDHQVENPDVIVSIHDEDEHPQQPRKKPLPRPASTDEKEGDAGETPRLDLTA